MGFFTTDKSPEALFKEKMSKKFYLDAAAIAYRKELPKNLIRQVATSEYEALKAADDEFHLGSLRDTFREYINA